MIGERLKEERKRLGLNQDAFAGLAGVSRRAYAEWEAGNTSPTAAQLAALSEEGVDVLYIVTGQRSVAAVPVTNRREFALLDNYRACEEEDKRAIERVALSAARTEPVARTEVKKSG
jgi:transcriptional regulator with XRE-family HTH domain